MDYWYSQQPEEISSNYTEWKKPVAKGYTLNEHIYRAFLQRQNYLCERDLEMFGKEVAPFLASRSKFTSFRLFWWLDLGECG